MPEECERPKDELHQGVGALLLLTGSALVFSASRMPDPRRRGAGVPVAARGIGADGRTPAVDSSPGAVRRIASQHEKRRGGKACGKGVGD